MSGGGSGGAPGAVTSLVDRDPVPPSVADLESLVASASQSPGGKNMSWENATTMVFAVIRPSAAARSPPVCRETSPCRHFQPIQIRLFGSIGRK